VSLVSTGVVIGVDVGGTNVLAGVVTPDGRVVSSVQQQTPHRNKHPRVVEDTIARAVRELSAERPALAVGVGAAGFVDTSGSTVAFSPHLSWRNEPLRAALEARLGVPVTVDNDANTTARAECRFGAGVGHAQVLCITLGTGIGGALVVDAAVFRGAHGMAGEFGHMQVVPGGRVCECGNRGCWEQYVSGNALARAAAATTGLAVVEAARAGEASAVELLAEAGAWLGTGLASLCAAFDPELIVVGGGLSQAGDLLLDPARAALLRNLTGRGYRPEPAVLPAALGVDAGLIGAADLARARLG